MDFEPIFTPVHILAKAGPGKDPMRVWCLASTEDQDEDNEKLVQKALDIQYLTKDGKFLWTHTQQGRIEPENILGVIDKAEVIKSGLYVEGLFLRGKPKAEQIYNDLMHNPETSPYRVSIEGHYKYFMGDGGRLCKSAIVRNIAFDANVVNTHTVAGVLKSLGYGTPHVCDCNTKLNELTNDLERMRLFLWHNLSCCGKSLPEVQEALNAWKKENLL